MERILIGADSEVLVGRGLPERLLPDSERSRKVAIFTQPGAFEIAQHVSGLLTESQDVAGIHDLGDREAAKSFRAVQEAYEWLAEVGLRRTDTIVAVGGGAVTDAAGFVAATWMRGVEVVHVPTTLLGAVDAAIGGKTAINVRGKNLVGAFWLPTRVVVDLAVLEGLPASLRREGAAEVIKAGLLADPAIVKAYRNRGLDVPPEEVVAPAISIKARIVSEDLTEQGTRALLNLGHTIGHGIEYASDLPHGESVAIGLVAAAAISEHLLGFQDTKTVVGTLEAAGLPTRSPPLDRDTVLNLVELDKKRTERGIRMVLLESIGQPRLMAVGPEDLELGLAAVGL